MTPRPELGTEPRTWTIAVDCTPTRANGDRLTDERTERKRFEWYIDHPEAWEVVTAVAVPELARLEGEAGLVEERECWCCDCTVHLDDPGMVVCWVCEEPVQHGPLSDVLRPNTGRYRTRWNESQAMEGEAGRLREALEPFAAFAARFDGVYDDDDGEENVGKPIWYDDDEIDPGFVDDGSMIVVADLRRARAALSPSSGLREGDALADAREGDCGPGADGADLPPTLLDRIRDLSIWSGEERVKDFESITYTWSGGEGDSGYETFESKLREGGGCHYSGVYHPDDGCVGNPCLYCGRAVIESEGAAPIVPPEGSP